MEKEDVDARVDVCGVFCPLPLIQIAKAADRLERVQPFNSNPAVIGPSPLLLLHTLWNRDKHRTITVVSGAVRGPDGLMYGRSPLSKDVRLVPRRDVAEIIEPESFFWGIPIHGHPLVQAKITPSGPGFPRLSVLSVAWVRTSGTRACSRACARPSASR